MIVKLLIWSIWILFQITIGYNLIMPMVLSVLCYFKKTSEEVQVIDIKADYAIIVTAYEQIAHIPEVVNSLLKLNYTNYMIYVVADKCDVSSLNFADERVVLLRPEVTLASNTRSHFYAIQHFKRNHNRLTIIDSDNIVHPAYLNELNRCFNLGYEAVQGVREAKNLDTTYACLDAARDIYYHFYDGKILFKVGSSATLSGSGMAFTTALYKECLGGKDVVGAGFDKVLQAAIVEKNIRIAFAENAIVYDEKTSHTNQLINQRSRWINTWFKYFKLGFSIIKKGITQPSRNQILFGLILLRPPIFLFLLLSFFCLVINIYIGSILYLFWLLCFVIFVTGFFVALIKSNTDKRVYSSLKNIPVFIFYQIVSLFKARNANKRSVATIHYHKGIVN